MHRPLMPQLLGQHGICEQNGFWNPKKLLCLILKGL